MCLIESDVCSDETDHGCVTLFPRKKMNLDEETNSHLTVKWPMLKSGRKYNDVVGHIDIRWDVGIIGYDFVLQPSR